ncbi:MAG: hypothetical protein AAFY71_09345 [Bacteroidota bacterium]
MQQKLEDYIRDHRDQLDIETPSEKLWDNIDGTLNRKTLSLWERYPLLKVAAAIVVIAVLGGVWYTFQERMPSTIEMTADLPPVDQPDSETDWKKAEEKYQDKILVLMQKIQQYPIEDDAQAKHILREVSQINVRMDDLKANMHPTEFDPDIAHEMLQLYQQKVHQLEILVDYLQHMKAG